MSFSCSFLMSLLSILKNFTILKNCLDIPFLLSALKDVLSHVLERVKVNKITERSSQKKFWKVLENNYFEEHLEMAASERVALAFY